MTDKIKNRVAESNLVTIDLEVFYPEGKRHSLDISEFLFGGTVLREKDFREQVQNYDWNQYQGQYIALTNTFEAIIPAWAFMLLTVQLTFVAKKIVLGNLEQLENQIFYEIISNLNLSEYHKKRVIIKGCSNKQIPENAYILITQMLQPIAKSIMYGEACSSVPLYKRK